MNGDIKSGRAELRPVSREVDATSTETFLGVYDFSYAPYALGDCLTWQENALVQALDQGYRKIRLCVVADPDRPSSSLQPHINTANYGHFIRELYPALLSCPLTTAIQVFRDRYSFNLFLLDSWRKGVGSWPAYEDHFNGQIDYISHRQINAFNSKHGHLPRLIAPRGYEKAVKSLIVSHSDAYLVAVNVRQSQMSRFPASLHRDSPISVWHRFFRLVGARYPEVLFLWLGRYGESDLELMQHPNVLAMRARGYTLGHELAMVHNCDLFMGTSSGFSTAATFSETPYVITNMEKRFSALNGVPIGTDRYPFGRERQIIHWEQETEGFLTRSFEEIYSATRRRRRALENSADASAGPHRG